MGYVEIIGNHRLPSQFAVRTIIFEELLELFRDADSLLPRKSLHVVADEAIYRAQSKSAIAQQLKTKIFCVCDVLVPQKLVTEQVPLILRASVPVQIYDQKRKEWYSCPCNCFEVINAL